MPVYLPKEIYEYLLQRNEKLQDKYGFTLPDQPKWIGSGTKGAAYKTNNGNVLKITYDRSEAKSSNLLVGKNPKYINDIYAVFEIKNYNKDMSPQNSLSTKNINQGNPLYGIYQEFLYPVTIDQFESIIWRVTGIHPPIPFRSINKEEYKKVINYTIGEVKTAKIEDIKKVVTWYFNSLKELKKFGIEYDDYGSNNTKQDSRGNLKIIDLGYSKSRNIPVDVFERKQIVTIGGLLTEVRQYEETVLTLSRQIINQLKNGKNEDTEKNYRFKFKNRDIKLKINIFPIDGMLDDPRKSPYFSTNAGVDPSTIVPRIQVEMLYSIDHLKKYFNYIISDLKDALRHELEHVSQLLAGDMTPDMKRRYEEAEDDYKYLLLPTEIPAMVRGLLKRAKTQRTNLQDLINSYVKSMDVTDKEADHIIQVYTDFAKRNNLPLQRT